ncbi:murein L,D-transpeptidase family protein [Breoghania sp.]|uniref:murein L,D-transpeptidase family protein n=1 Tax=Breoghania sp. TaxID=2065378 RepID=UPI00260D103A|nr:murein L,D-transpeptidase family protein [Breoghania sp.]MDJ0931624.1 murein L,D-transpeptidase family protein [Breoghania sp.]
MSGHAHFAICRFRDRIRSVARWGLIAAGLVALAGCQADELGYGAKAERPLSHAIKAEMQAKNMKASGPILVRLFKEESKLEVWKQTKTGRYALLKGYDICKWSGKLGPKKKEGDRQAPEGFYTIRPAQMNPNSSYHLSFNTGFPNAYDRSLGRTGSNLMVHGACSSRGCYAMTDEQIQEIYSLAREAFRGGQRDFQLEAFPFRMTAENMAKHANDENMPFWRVLKRGYDHFAITHIPPKVDVCDRRYVFDAQPEESDARFDATRACPAYEVPEPLRVAVAAKEKADDQKMAEIVAQLAARRGREEEWKDGDTSIAKLFGPGNEAGEEARGEKVDTTGSVLSYATPDGTPAPGAPVPAGNPQRVSSSKADEGSGFFSNLFMGKDRAASPVAPASERPEGAQMPKAAVGPGAGQRSGRASECRRHSDGPCPRKRRPARRRRTVPRKAPAPRSPKWFRAGSASANPPIEVVRVVLIFFEDFLRSGRGVGPLGPGCERLGIGFGGAHPRDFSHSVA